MKFVVYSGEMMQEGALPSSTAFDPYRTHGPRTINLHQKLG